LNNFKNFITSIKKKSKCKIYRLIDIQKKLINKRSIKKIICFGKVIGPVDSDSLKSITIVSLGMTKKVENIIVNRGGNFIDLHYFIKNKFPFKDFVFYESIT